MHSLLLPIGISMNLKWHLISRIILIALLCLLATVAYALYHTNQQARQEARTTAETIAKQLEFQLLRINAGFGQPERFPDFDLWQ